MNRLGRRSLLSTLGAVAAGCIISLLINLASPSQAAEISQPGHLIPTTDTKFGSRAIKMSNPNHEIPGLGLTWGNVAIHHSSIDQAWNADQTISALDRGTKPKVFFDGTTYQPLLAFDKPGDAKKFLERGEASFGDHKGNPPDDGRMIAVTPTRLDGKRDVFAYAPESERKYPDIDMNAEYYVGHTTISPSVAELP